MRAYDFQKIIHPHWHCATDGAAARRRSAAIYFINSASTSWNNYRKQPRSIKLPTARRVCINQNGNRISFPDSSALRWWCIFCQIKASQRAANKIIFCYFTEEKINIFSKTIVVQYFQVMAYSLMNSDGDRALQIDTNSIMPQHGI